MTSVNSHMGEVNNNLKKGHSRLTPGEGGQPAVSAGSAPASVHWGRNAARHDPGLARRKYGEGNKSAGAHGGSDAPSHRTRKSGLVGGNKERRRRKRRRRKQTKKIGIILVIKKQLIVLNVLCCYFDLISSTQFASGKNSKLHIPE